ncbi:MAG: protein kinase [Acidobacteriota bacterium]
MTEGGSLGPYRIVREIGSGSFGSVLLGRHEETGVEVAIKTVKVPSEHRVSSLRREIQALARVRHPGVVRILDDGVTSRGPWYAMDLLAGTTLTRYVQGVEEDSSLQRSVDLQASTELLAASLSATRVMSSDRTEVQSSSGGWSSAPGRSLFGPPSPPQARPRILTIVRRLCAPLSYLHGEGILHRDLKPDNVLVTADGMPVIVDFGLTSEAFDAELRETMEVVGEIAGTALYMAPEQARGELLDARADLYALGCILYQLLTGRPPFLAETAAQILLMHVNHAPVPPSALCGDLDPKVDDVVLRLLAKEPRERLGHADDVAQALLALGAAVEPLAGPPPRTYLYRPGLAGREEALGTIDRSMERLAHGRGALVLVGGEAGAGKTRLVKEAGRRAMRAGPRVVACDCVAGLEGVAPLQGLGGLLSAVADVCREKGIAEARRVLGSHGAILAPYEATIAAVVRGLDTPPPAPLPAEAARLRLLRSLASVLAAFAGGRGIVLMIDDLHAGDELTIEALRHLSRTGFFDTHPVVVVASYRTEEAGPMASLRTLPGAEDVGLDRLGDDAIAAIASDMLALRPLPRRFRRFLVSSAEGNPFFVAQYLRTAVAEGVLLRDPSGQWRMRRVDASRAQPLEEAIPLPATLRDLASRRLAGISPAAARVVGPAAVLGREVERALLEAVSGLGDAEIDDGVAELVRRHCVHEVGSRIRFRHGNLRDVAYDTVVPEERLVLHRRAAEALERASDAAAAGARAHHWDRAGEPARAIPSYLDAAQAARARYAWRDAEALLRALLALPGVTAGQRTAALRALADVLRLQGRTAEAIVQCHEALGAARLSGEPRDEAIALGNVAGLELLMGHADEARARYEACIAIYNALGEIDLEAQAIENLAVVHGNAGRRNAALTCHEQALAMHRATSNLSGELTVLTNLGGLRTEQGRWTEAMALHEQAYELAVRLGDRESEANAIGNVGSLLQSRGNLREARDAYERARAIFHEIGLLVGEGISIANLAHLTWEQGRARAARAIASEARHALEEADAGSVLAFLLVVVGWIDQDEGRHPEAREAIDRARQLSLGRSTWEALCDQSLAELDALEGEIARASERFERAVRTAGALDDPLLPASVATGRARFLRRTGGTGDAAALGEAEAALRAAGEIPRLAMCLCERGHLALMAGRGAERWHQEASALVKDLGLEPMAPVQRRIDALGRAIEAERAAPGSLLHGECRADYPPRLLASIAGAS